MRRQSRWQTIIPIGCVGITSASAIPHSLQYEDAIRAFEQVVKLRPDYKDGYINVGLTYIEWEKYTEVRWLL